MQHRQDEAEVGGDGCLLSEHALDRPLDLVVARVDLVVEGDDLVTELDILGLKGVDRASHRAEHDSPLLLEARLERVEVRLILDPGHYPKRPVT